MPSVKSLIRPRVIIGFIIITGIIGEVIYKTVQLSGRSDDLIRVILVFLFVATWLIAIWLIVPQREK